MTADLRARLQDAVGATLRIERELTPGGMSRVFEARDTTLDRRIAIKVLEPRLTATVSAERFTREIRVSARLQHPNIVPVLSTGECDGLPYYTMPFVDGESLRARLGASGPVPLPEATRILRDVAGALAFAHANGVVHRDIKPENILLAGHAAIVADFGIAKALTAAVVGDAPDTKSPTTLTQVGTSLGTPAYMAPEQITGAEVDAQADVYSWGVVAYELIAGKHPFAGKQTAQQLMAAHIAETPAPVSTHRAGVPQPLIDLITSCLAKDPGARPRGGAEIERVLELLAAGTATAPASGGSLNPMRWRAGTRAGAVAAMVVMAAAIFWSPWRRDVWAGEDLESRLMQLADELAFDSGARLVKRARAELGSDSALEAAARIVLTRANFTSEPTGARVYRQAYRGPDTTWTLVGTTPIDSVEIPRGLARYRIEREGYVPYFAGRTGGFTLRAAADTSPDELIGFAARQIGRNDLPNGVRHLEPPELPAFSMGRYEVTNREFKRFVAVRGYERRELWDEPVMRNGVRVPWERAKELFVDRTGLPGPSTWEAGAYPFGADRYPVRGVSWYEARAYARFAGMQLPTIYHWSSVANLGGQSHYIVSESTIGTDSAAPVGRSRGITQGGLFDLAGNAREWAANATGTQRFILGGAWNEPAYMYLYAIAADPLDRSATNGFRVARYDSAAASRLTAAVSLSTRDFAKERPASDEVFEVYRRLYEYDPVPLRAKIAAVDTSPEWIRERITYGAPYANEEINANLYLPRGHATPYQTVMYFPGSAVIQSAPPPNGAPSVNVVNLIRSGRAVMVPTFKGTWERSDSLSSRTDRMSAFYRARIIVWAKEVRATVNYLHSRSDVDTTRLAYFGSSMGGRVAPINLVVEPRFKTAILLCPGLGLDPSPAEVDPFHFLPRVTIPTLMVGGRLDGVFPMETSQEPYFRLLGTRTDAKEFVKEEAGHCPTRDAFYRRALPWLDKYLGRVR